jgi:hypothetical protein
MYSLAKYNNHVLAVIAVFFGCMIVYHFIVTMREDIEGFAFNQFNKFPMFNKPKPIAKPVVKPVAKTDVKPVAKTDVKPIPKPTNKPDPNDSRIVNLQTDIKKLKSRLRANEMVVDTYNMKTSELKGQLQTKQTEYDKLLSKFG